MNPEWMEYLGPLSHPLVVVGVCFLSGIVPLVNAEIFLAAAAVGLSTSQCWQVIILATMAQVVAKTMMYTLSSRIWGNVQKRPQSKWKTKIAKSLTALEGTEKYHFIFFFISALISIPPFYFTAIAAGIVRGTLISFLWGALLGRFIRFAALIFLFERLSHFFFFS